MKIIRKTFSIVLVVCLITVAGNSVVSASESRNISLLDIVNTVNELGSSKKPGIKLKASKSAITVKWSGVKKSKIKGAQIKMANNKAMKGAKTYKLSKSKAKKMSYSFKVGDQIVTNSKYYFKVRIKNGSKWTSWSSVKSSKVKKNTSSKKTEEEKSEADTEEEKKLEKKYKCNHTLAAGETSEIIAVGDMVFDVHTCTELDAWGDNKLFVVYLKNLTDENGKIVREIDYSKVKYIFDDGKTSGELWNWLDHDFAGYDGLIYSIPNYKTAMADVYRYVPKSHDYKFEIHEEKVPHDYDGNYKVTLMYDGKIIGTQTRSCPACINKAIKLFRDTKGEEYLDDYTKDEVAFREKHSSWGPIEAWQIDTFNYFGCQNGTILQNSIVRYYYGHRTFVRETPRRDYLPQYNSSKFGYAVHYKQFGGRTVQAPQDVEHVSCAAIDVFDENGMTINNPITGGTGSFDGYNKTDMPYYDYLLPINEKYNKQNTYKAWQQESYPLQPVEN